MKKLINNTSKQQFNKFSENRWLAIGLITLVSMGVYYNSLKAPFILDDKPKIVNNPDIKKLDNIKTKLIYPYSKKFKTFKRNDPSRPLTYLTFTLNYHFGKLNVFGYHLFNLVLHILNSILVFLLAGKVFFYTINRKSFTHLSFFIAIFFALHPANVNTVTYIFARSGELATLFYFSSLLFFLMAIEKNKNFYILSLVSYILSLLSKPIAVTFPIILFTFDYIFLCEYKLIKIKERKYYHISFWIILLICNALNRCA